MHAWKLETGECVTHIDEDLPATVEYRVLADNGDEYYGVDVHIRGNQKRRLTILGTSLRRCVPRDGDCARCELALLGACSPMLLTN